MTNRILCANLIRALRYLETLEGSKVLMTHAGRVYTIGEIRENLGPSSAVDCAGRSYASGGPDDQADPNHPGTARVLAIVHAVARLQNRGGSSFAPLLAVAGGATLGLLIMWGVS